MLPLSALPTWRPRRLCDHHDGLVPFTDDGLSGSRRFAWGKWALSAAAVAAAAVGCCLPSVRGSGEGGRDGRRTTWLPSPPPLSLPFLPAAHEIPPSVDRATTGSLTARCRPRPSTRSPARPLTHSFARCHCCCIGRRAGASYHHQNLVWRCLKNHQWRRQRRMDDGREHGRAVGRLDGWIIYLSK